MDDVYNEFKERGIIIARDIRNEAYGIREFGVYDTNGYFIRVSERIITEKPLNG